MKEARIKEVLTVLLYHSLLVSVHTYIHLSDLRPPLRLLQEQLLWMSPDLELLLATR